MATRWEAAPAEQALLLQEHQGNWWDAAPVVSQTGTARVEPSTGVDARGAATGAIEGFGRPPRSSWHGQDAATYGMGWFDPDGAGVSPTV